MFILTSKRNLAILAGLAAVFLWGASFVATKIALASFPPLTLIITRISIGVLFLFPLVLRVEGITLPTRRELPPLIILGLIGITFYQWLQATGIQLTSASEASWLTASAPVFMAAMGWTLLKEKIHIWQVVGLIVALGGDLWIALSKGILPINFSNLWGPLVVLIGAITWAGYSILGKHLVVKVSPLRLTFYSMVIGLIMTIPIVVFTGSWKFPEVTSSREWMAVLFLGLGSTGLAYALYFFALKGAETALVAAIQYLEPIITVVLASWLVAESVTINILAGGFLITLGVWLVNRFAPKEVQAR